MRMEIPTLAALESLLRNAALQIDEYRIAQLIFEPSSGAQMAMLYSICSL